MPYLFKAKTTEGYTIKILAELLQHNLKTACFVIEPTGISLRQMDSHRHVLIDIHLSSDKFSIYKCKQVKRFIGINLNHLHKMLKSIKKKDSVILFIKEDSEDDLGIQVIPKEGNRVTTSTIKIQNIQHLDIAVPEDYEKPVIVPSNEYQKMCKDMSNIGGEVSVFSKGFYIKFSCNQGAIYSREVLFGEIEDDEEEEEEEEEEVSKVEYSEDFDTEQLHRIVKLSGLGETMQVYPKMTLPLKFKSNVGQLGQISIYIKNKKQIEEEQLCSNDDE